MKNLASKYIIMTEAQVAFLYNIAGMVSQSEDNPTNTLLKSYYLMRCKELTGGQKLPSKHFSNTARCQRCCLEWKGTTEVKVRPIKLTKKQRRRKSSQNANENEIVQICTFCKNNNVTTALKPRKENVKFVNRNINDHMKAIKGIVTDNIQKKTNLKAINVKKKPEINVYSNAFDVFSLQNKNNTLANTIKEQPKVIKNNKKKKDKFAGLCQKAVLASAKMKEPTKQNKLNLFLKPST